MIDLVELKATHDSAAPTEILDAAREIAPKPYEKRTLGDSLWVGAFARQVLALSDEVERLKDVIEDKNEAIAQLCGSHNEKLARAVAAESEAQALRERMGEIHRTVRFTAKSDKTHCILALDRIAALSTTPKEKEG